MIGQKKNMILYMIRHGQSIDNAVRRFSGWANSPLSERGIADAMETAKRLHGVQFDKVYSSDTRRAAQTCEIIRPDAKPIFTELLREINVGELSGKLVADCPMIYGERITEDRRARDYRFYGGENTDDQMARVRSFIDMVEKDSGTVAAFCHEGTIKCALTIVEGSETFINRDCKNGAICIFEYSEGEWTLLEWDV